MEAGPLVSVIIPTFNRREKLRHAIASAVSQSYKNIEIIVLDDGSTDGTEKLIEELDIANLRYYQKENEGLPGLSRNFGAKYAKGEYLAFLDSDDKWLPEKVSRQVADMESSPGIELCFTQGVGWLGDEKVLISGSFFKKSGSIFYPLLIRNFVITSSVILKRKTFEDIGGFSSSKNLSIAEDLKLWLRVSKKGAAHYIDEPLIEYEMEEGISGDINKRFLCVRDVVSEEMRVNKSYWPLRVLVMSVFWLRWFIKIRKDKKLVKEAIAKIEDLNNALIPLFFFRILKRFC